MKDYIELGKLVGSVVVVYAITNWALRFFGLM